MCGYEDPIAIRCYSTTFLPITRRLLSSQGELTREIQNGASPLEHFISVSGLAWNQPKQTKWTEVRLRCLLTQARTAQVLMNDLTKEFLVKRYFPHCGKEDMQKWRWYQENIGYRHYWSRALCCNFDWDWDLSSCLKRLFRLPKAAKYPIRSCVAQKNEWSIDSTASCAPVLLKVRYISQAGKIKYKTFHADPSLEDVTREGLASNDNDPSPTLEVPISGTPPPKCKLEYENILEYREINRHARRKIETWLNEGWRVSWEWNGMHKYESIDSRWKYDNRYIPAHWMVLRRPRTNLSSSTSTSTERSVLRFPKTPIPSPDPNPRWGPVVYSDIDWGCVKLF